MMTIVKINFIITFFFFGSINCFSQNKIRIKADKNFENYFYNDAVKEYRSLQQTDTPTLRKLAESYCHIKDYANAESAYANVVNAGDASSEDIYRYASILHINQKYKEAGEWMKKYRNKNSTDSRAIRYFAEEGLIDKLLKDKSEFQIRNLKINSEQQDFATGYYKNNVIFSSSNSQPKLIKRQWNYNGLPFLDIYFGEIADNGELINRKAVHRKVNRKLHEGAATVSADGNTIAFTRNNFYPAASDGSVKLELYSAHFKDGKLLQIKPFHFNNKEYSVGQPSLSEDGKTLYFVSDMPGGLGGSDIYKVEKNTENNWGIPKNLGSQINTEGNEMFPFIHSDGILFFASDGHIGLGGLDIFFSSLHDSKWGKVTNLGVPVNSNRDDFSAIFDKKFSSGYFSSNRLGGKGDDDIYSIKILKKFIPHNKVIAGKVIRKANNAPLMGVKVILQDETGKNIKEAITQIDGTYILEALPGVSYILKTDYNEFGEEKIDIKKLTNDRKEDFFLSRNDLSLIGKLCDAKTKEPIRGVLISGKENNSGKAFEATTDSNGNFLNSIGIVPVGELINYELKLSKTGFIPKYINLSFIVQKNKDMISFYELFKKDIELDKIEIGQDLGEMLDMKPIYFDVNKYNIKKQASIELDKIIKIMNENPTMEIELGSHTDCRGSSSANKLLSDNRAKASADYIKRKINNANRIKGRGYGEDKLKNNCGCDGAKKSNCSEQQHQENRRTEFIIIN